MAWSKQDMEKYRGGSDIWTWSEQDEQKYGKKEDHGLGGFGFIQKSLNTPLNSLMRNLGSSKLGGVSLA